MLANRCHLVLDLSSDFGAEKKQVILQIDQIWVQKA
jgi:hypothetical protein